MLAKLFKRDPDAQETWGRGGLLKKEEKATAPAACAAGDMPLNVMSINDDNMERCIEESTYGWSMVLRFREGAAVSSHLTATLALSL